MGVIGTDAYQLFPNVAELPNVDTTSQREKPNEGGFQHSL
jgi:hypothetical protein